MKNIKTRVFGLVTLAIFISRGITTIIISNAKIPSLFSKASERNAVQSAPVMIFDDTLKTPFIVQSWPGGSSSETQTQNTAVKISPLGSKKTTKTSIIKKTTHKKDEKVAPANA